MSDTLEVFLLILFASFLFSSLVSRIPLLRIPSAIGYLLFGVLLGGGIIPITAPETQWLLQLGDFGLLFLNVPVRPGSRFNHASTQPVERQADKPIISEYLDFLHDTLAKFC